MPQRNVYIRKQNLRKWDALANKSELVNAALASTKSPLAKKLKAPEVNSAGELPQRL